ncbi:MAG TPA: VOC family protein [Acidimicrobiales bacterium]|nr:VOC family protein [Acidimicrobiales bacterium]
MVDRADLNRAAEFWTEALGYVRVGEPDGPYRVLLPADGKGIEVLLQRVSDVKTAESRIHLDLRTKDLDEEVERICALGATRLTTEAGEEAGWRWHVLADPDGNELCVLEPPPRYWARAGTDV